MSVDLIIDGPVAKIVLNRPEKLNALTHEMRAQLRDYTQQLRFDESVRAIIVTGEGRAFCTGADVGRMQRGGLRAEREKMQGGSHQFLRTLHATEKPVIAAVRGPTFAFGMAKKLFHMASGPSYEDFLDYEAFVQPQLDQTEDHREGVAAFREKRQPNFVGR